VRITDFGVYRVTQTGAEAPAVNTAYGSIKAVKDGETLLFATTNVAAEVGKSFGFRFIPEGGPPDAELPIVFRCIHPALRNPDRGELSTEGVFQWRCKVGERWRFIYGIEEEWEAVPGEWTLQLWLEGRMLTQKKFLLHSSGND